MFTQWLDKAWNWENLWSIKWRICSAMSDDRALFRNLATDGFRGNRSLTNSFQFTTRFEVKFGDDTQLRVFLKNELHSFSLLAASLTTWKTSEKVLKLDQKLLHLSHFSPELKPVIWFTLQIKCLVSTGNTTPGWNGLSYTKNGFFSIGVFPKDNPYQSFYICHCLDWPFDDLEIHTS